MKRPTTRPVQLPPLPQLHPLDSIAISEIETRYKLVQNGKVSELPVLALELLVYGYFHEAEVCCVEALELEAENFEMRFLHGITLDRLGDMREAISEFERASENAPDLDRRHDCLYNIAINYLRLEEPETALQYFALCEQFPAAMLVSSRVRIQQKNAQTAIPLLNALAASHPRDHRVQQLLAEAHQQLGDTQASRHHQALAASGVSAIETDLIASILRVRANSFGVRAKFYQGDLLVNEEQYSKAAQVIAPALEIQWNYQAAMRLAAAYLRLKQVEPAIILLSKVIEQEGGFADAYAMLGTAYDMAGDRSRAVEAWKQAIALGPSPGAHYSLAAHFENSPESSRHHTTQALFESAGRAFREGDPDKAISMLSPAVAQSPDHHDAWLLLGDAFQNVGKTKQAEDSYRRAMELRPLDGRAQQRLQ